MACLIEVDCLDCGKSFSFMEGGLMEAMAIRCEKCGVAKLIAYDTLKKAGIDWRDTQGVEKYASSCECGGRFKIDAKARCPNCKSTNIKGKEQRPKAWFD